MPKQGERDSKPIIIGLEKAFHPKSVTTHTNTHTSIFFFFFFFVPFLHTNTISAHTQTHTGQTSFFIAHSHTYAGLSSNKCTLD